MSNFIKFDKFKLLLLLIYIILQYPVCQFKVFKSMGEGQSTFRYDSHVRRNDMCESTGSTSPIACLGIIFGIIACVFVPMTALWFSNKADNERHDIVPLTILQANQVFTETVCTSGYGCVDYCDGYLQVQYTLVTLDSVNSVYTTSINFHKSNFDCDEIRNYLKDKNYTIGATTHLPCKTPPNYDLSCQEELDSRNDLYDGMLATGIILAILLSFFICICSCDDNCNCKCNCRCCDECCKCCDDMPTSVAPHPITNSDKPAKCKQLTIKDHVNAFVVITMTACPSSSPLAPTFVVPKN